MPVSDQPPLVSIVIPIYNEEGILHSAVVDLIDRLQTAQATTPEPVSYTHLDVYKRQSEECMPRISA